jgi:hypothetical protein
VEREEAVWLAAAEVEGVSVEQARDVVAKFLAQVVQCSVCNGTGTFTFLRDFKTAKTHGKRLGDRTILAGTTVQCPLCVGERLDPRYIGWHCVREHGYERCAADSRSEDHPGCGLRVMLPLPNHPAAEPESGL